MIALIVEDRCTGCGDCVRACPMDVFDFAPPGAEPAVPVIARQDACQTCFLCELCCKADALYVDPDCETPARPDPAEIERAGLLGQYRRHSGWDEWAAGGEYPNEHWRMEEMFTLARALPPERG
ncbi:MAG: ferredoxin family protein [Caulobacteraceae bacterium]